MPKVTPDSIFEPKRRLTYFFLLSGYPPSDVFPAETPETLDVRLRQLF
jgi:hypothetical protein